MLYEQELSPLSRLALCAQFDATNLKAFRKQHPAGENVVVAHDVDRPRKRTFGELVVHFESLPGLIGRLGA